MAAKPLGWGHLLSQASVPDSPYSAALSALPAARRGRGPRLARHVHAAAAPYRPATGAFHTPRPFHRREDPPPNICLAARCAPLSPPLRPSLSPVSTSKAVILLAVLAGSCNRGAPPPRGCAYRGRVRRHARTPLTATSPAKSILSCLSPVHFSSPPSPTKFSCCNLSLMQQQLIH